MINRLQALAHLGTLPKLEDEPRAKGSHSNETRWKTSVCEMWCHPYGMCLSLKKHELIYMKYFLESVDNTFRWNVFVNHRIGLWENLQESPIFDGKNHGFL